jgi:methanogenic corrinoid protein MtbC1
MSVAGLAPPAEQFMQLALAGKTAQAVRFALALLDTGTAETSIITEVLAPAQRQIGARWQRNELSVADEHIAAGVALSALYALSSAAPDPNGTSPVVVACAEGEWHSIAAEMIAELLRAEGIPVICLGASAPAPDVARLLERRQPAALAVSCSVPLFYAGVTKLADAAHAQGIPVIAGGRALRGAPRRALLLGADAYADDVADAAETLAAWTGPAPDVRTEPSAGCPEADLLSARAEELADLAFTELFSTVAAMAGYSRPQLDRTREDLAHIVRFVAAAQRVDETTVFTDFLDWLVEVLSTRGVPKAALVTGLAVLQPLLEEHDLAAGGLGAAGLEHLATAST